MSTSVRDSRSSQDTKFAATISASAWGFSLDGSYSSSESSAETDSLRSSFSKTSISNIGGIPPLGNSASDMLSWILSAESRPMPTSYELGEIWELLEGPQQDSMKRCLAQLSGVPSSEYSLTGEATRMRFGTTMPDGQPANAFASSPQALLRFNSKRQPLNSLNDDFGTLIDCQAALPGAVYVAQGLLMQPFVNHFVLPFEQTDGSIHLQPYKRRSLPNRLDSYLRTLQGLYANFACQSYVSDNPLKPQRIELYSSCLLRGV